MAGVWATNAMIPAIKAIWQDAFPEDTPDDVSFFFSRVYSPERCLVWVQNEQPVSMVFLLPATLELTGDEGPISLRMHYIYAAATLSAFRGQGIFGKLLTQAQGIARDSGIDASFLRPAEPSLFSYYERFGYRAFFRVRSDQASCTEFLSGRGLKLHTNRITDAVHPAASPINCAARRDELLANHHAWVRWPDFLVNYAVDAVKKNGGALLTNEGGWALCDLVGNTVRICEWLCKPDEERALRHAVVKHFCAKEVAWRQPIRPSDEGLSGVDKSFGMICPLTDQAKRWLALADDSAPYMGLAFD